MREVNYKKVNAFTSGRSLGNPAACIYLEDGQTLSHDEMLGIAKQHKGFVSEVVYCARSQQSGFDLVYYSSEGEVDFADMGQLPVCTALLKAHRVY